MIAMQDGQQNAQPQGLFACTDNDPVTIYRVFLILYQIRLTLGAPKTILVDRTIWPTSTTTFIPLLPVD